MTTKRLVGISLAVLVCGASISEARGEGDSPDETGEMSERSKDRGGPLPARERATPVWNGFWYKWKNHPHRLSLVESRFAGGKQLMGLKIGACPEDEGQFAVPYRKVVPGDLTVVTGTAAAIQTTGSIDAWQRGSTTVTVPLPAKGAGTAAVLLQGIRIRSKADDLSRVGGQCDVASAVGKFFMEVFTGCPPSDCAKWDSGWHLGGVSVKLSRAAVSGGAASFKVDVGVKPSESGDPINGGDCKCYGADWPKSRATNYTVEVDYVVLAGGAGDLHVASYEVAAKSTRATTEQKAVVEKAVVGKSGFAKAVPGLTQFALELTGRGKYPGRYVRELGFTIDKFVYDKDRGRGTVTNRMVFSNRSQLPERWTMKASMSGAMVQVKASGFSVSGSRVEGSVTRANSTNYVTSTPVDLQ